MCDDKSAIAAHPGFMVSLSLTSISRVEAVWHAVSKQGSSLNIKPWILVHWQLLAQALQGTHKVRAGMLPAASLQNPLHMPEPFIFLVILQVMD